MTIAPEHERALAAVARIMTAARDRWWVIGSMAVALHGADPGDIADIDVLTSERDGRAALAAAGLASRHDDPHDRFASRLFARWEAPPVPVEFMAGLRVRSNGGWHEVALSTRQRIAIGSTEVFVPETGELIALLELFGRPKDAERIRALRRMG